MHHVPHSVTPETWQHTVTMLSLLCMPCALLTLQVHKMKHLEGGVNMATSMLVVLCLVSC